MAKQIIILGVSTSPLVESGVGSFLVSDHVGEIATGRGLAMGRRDDGGKHRDPERIRLGGAKQFSDPGRDSGRDDQGDAPPVLDESQRATKRHRSRHVRGSFRRLGDGLVGLEV